MSLLVEIRKKLDDFTLDVSFETDGGVLGLLGASGSGKSMTLMCVAGIVKPDCGRIVLNGNTLFDSKRRVNLPPQERRVGYLFQHYALFPNMTVRQNILCGLHNANSNKNIPQKSDEESHKRNGSSSAFWNISNRNKEKVKKERAAAEMIELMQLEGLEKHRPAQLSGGQQQRTALARILVNNPELLILDEPFSALDTHLRAQLQVRMQKLLKEFGKDSLLVTHDRNEAYQLCPQIAVLDDGKLIAKKPAKELFANPESRQAAYLTGCKNVADAKKAGEYEIYVPSWGLRFTTEYPVRDDLCAVAIRAHYFQATTAQNRFPVRFVNEIEGPFEYILEFRYENQNDDSPGIWWRIPKENKSIQLPAELGIAPVNILPLYQ